MQFEDLIDSLGDNVQAVVVFIDDMDRCSTETIVETFEAMRLFLHAPKTAYVVGAHYDIVDAALDGRYPARREGDEALGRNYLEKMLQNSVAVPPLSEPEARPISTCSSPSCTRATTSTSGCAARRPSTAHATNSPSR